MIGIQVAAPPLQAVPTRHASPAAHCESEVHTAVLDPHLPHELQIAVPLTSLWHALQFVAESGLHPLKASADCGTAMSYGWRSTPHTWPLVVAGVVLDVAGAEEVELLVGRSVELEDKEKVVVDAEVVLEGRVLDVERVSDEVLRVLDERLEVVDERLEAVDERLESVDERLGEVDEPLEAVEERLGTVEEALDAVDERLETVDEDRELASLEEDDAGVVVLAADRDEETVLEDWEEL